VAEAGFTQTDHTIGAFSTDRLTLERRGAPRKDVGDLDPPRRVLPYWGKGDACPTEGDF